eukprot:TRINITY_DN54524_c0_g1_i1.p1 TRINITY_DN54524_c0_g1~~TRINITY_DN54524_c0_g1_i1.p1  ORF type:complete len:472 (-),score=51.14 TRINITY_DN54524_c0_g1_i1:178-1401(-)
MMLSRAQACGAKTLRSLRAEVRNHGCRLLDSRQILEAHDDDACANVQLVCSAEATKDLAERFGLQVISGELGSHIRSENRSMRLWREPVAHVLSDAFYDDYRDLEQLRARLTDIAAASGGVLESFDLSTKSIEGRPITAYAITGEGWVSGGPRAVFSCQLHAREWVTSMSCTYVIEQASKMAKENPAEFRGIKLVVAPVFNPDGFLYSASNDRYWRKNRRVIQHLGLCDGVDLNRNFDVDFGDLLGGGFVSTDACSEVYDGLSAASEPETKALQALLTAHPTSVHIDVHTSGCLVMGPWSYTMDSFGERATEADDLGESIRKAMAEKHSKNYYYATGGRLSYLASGTASDFASKHGALGYTIELPPCQDDIQDHFAPPNTYIRPAAEELMEAFHVVLQKLQDEVASR